MIRAELEQKRLFRPPVVYVHPSCGEQVARLKQIVDRMGGTCAGSEGQSGVTHAVYPFGPNGDPDDGQHYMRNMGAV
jgi:hypothetical protein